MSTMIQDRILGRRPINSANPLMGFSTDSGLSEQLQRFRRRSGDPSYVASQLLNAPACQCFPGLSGYTTSIVCVLKMENDPSR